MWQDLCSIFNQYGVWSHAVAVVSGMVIGFVVGRLSKKETTDMELIKMLIAIVVVIAWVYKQYLSTIDHEILMTFWDNMIMGIVVGTFFDPKPGVIKLLKEKILK